MAHTYWARLVLTAARVWHGAEPTRADSGLQGPRMRVGSVPTALAASHHRSCEPTFAPAPGSRGGVRTQARGSQTALGSPSLPASNSSVLACNHFSYSIGRPSNESASLSNFFFIFFKGEL